MTELTPSSTYKHSALIICGHCGKQSVFQFRGEGIQGNEVLWKNPIDAIQFGHDYQTITTWCILECALCHQPTFVQEYITYSFYFPEETSILATETIVLYPKVSIKALLIGLPQKIAEEYEAALQVQNISLNACVVLLRRTLETICNHEKLKVTHLKIKLSLEISKYSFATCANGSSESSNWKFRSSC